MSRDAVPIRERMLRCLSAHIECYERMLAAEERLGSALQGRSDDGSDAFGDLAQSKAADCRELGALDREFQLLLPDWQRAIDAADVSPADRGAVAETALRAQALADRVTDAGARNAALVRGGRFELDAELSALRRGLAAVHGYRAGDGQASAAHLDQEA